MIEVNEYFDGDVKSLSFNNGTLPATVGVMMPGEYTFNTSAKETVSVVSGEMSVHMPHSSEAYVRYGEGESFEVPADSAFHLRLSTQVAYLCVYG